MKRIFIVSKYRGDVERNIQVARALCLAVSSAGHAPFASHIFATQFLDDDIPEQRAAGIAAGREWMKVSDEVWVWTHERPLSEGMLGDVAAALEQGIPVIDWSPSGGQVPWDPEKYK